MFSVSGKALNVNMVRIMNNVTQDTFVVIEVCVRKMENPWFMYTKEIRNFNEYEKVSKFGKQGSSRTLSLIILTEISILYYSLPSLHWNKLERSWNIKMLKQIKFIIWFCLWFCLILIIVFGFQCWSLLQSYRSGVNIL